MVLQEMLPHKGWWDCMYKNHIVSECGADTICDPHLFAVHHHDVHSAGAMLYQQQQPAPGGQQLHKCHTYTDTYGQRTWYPQSTCLQHTLLSILFLNISSDIKCITIYRC
jgi:hypothetical protein